MKPAIYLTLLTCAVLAAALPACGDDDLTRGDAGTDAQDDAAFTVACAYPDRTVREILLPGSVTEGVLRGPSQNASTTCTRSRGAGGPEEIFFFYLKERAIVSLRVVSEIDTVVAIRRQCDDAISEVACSDSQSAGSTGFPVDAGMAGFPGGPTMPGPMPPGPMPPGTMPPPPLAFDAGAPPPTGAQGRPEDGSLRTALDPGLYYVIVDEAEPFGVGGEFQLEANSFAPPPNASCAKATTLTHGLQLGREELDLAGDVPPACTGAEARNALYYAAVIPSGEQLAVRVTPTGGQKDWQPVLQVLGGCVNATCLAGGEAGVGSDRVVRYVNNGPNPLPVLVSVSSNVPVNGATFSLSAKIGVPFNNGMCAAAAVVKDGSRFIDQDLSDAREALNGNCGPPVPSLYYKAVLLPQQSITLTLVQKPPFMGGLFMTAMGGACGSPNCLASGGFGNNTLTYANATGAEQAINIAIGSFGGAMGLFDLSVSMTLPPGGVSVAPISGLQVSEAGATDTFTVVLIAPPLEPVTIPLQSLDTTEGTVSPTQLVFTPQNWKQPQTVTVKGVDDGEKDGNQTFTIAVNASMSAEMRYAGIDGNDVTVRNRDNEAGITVTAGMNLGTNESERQATFTVELNKQPTADVRIPLGSSDVGEGTVSPAVLTFTSANWNVRQTVTVTGVDDNDKDGTQTYSIQFGAAESTDGDYAGVTHPAVQIKNHDNEFVTTAPLVVSGSLNCSFGGMDGRLMTIDAAGNLYMGMLCNAGFAFDGGVRPPPPPQMTLDAGGAVSPDTPQLWVATSHDGGLSWKAPVPTNLPFPTGASIVGAGDGVVHALSMSMGSILYSRTTDGGVTWKAPTNLSGGMNGLARLSAAGDTVAAATWDTVWHNDTAGAGMFTTTKLPFKVGGATMIRVAADEKTVWFGWVDSQIRISKSTNGGATFGTPVSAGSNIFADAIALSETHVFVTQTNTLWVDDLNDIGAPQSVTGLGANDIPRAIISDDGGTTTVLETRNGALRAYRLTKGATQLSSPRSIDQDVRSNDGVALAENAVAIGYNRGGQVVVTIQTFE